MYKFEETAVAPSGLRYTSKEGGSRFQGMGNGETLSCIKCGQHKLRRNGTFKRYVTALLFFCLDCKPAKPALPPKSGLAS
jgi:hypothetical protein